MSIWLSGFLLSLLSLSPYLLIDLVAVILALILWRRHPRVSLLTLLATGLSVAVAVVGNFMLSWLPEYLVPDHLENYGESLEKRILLMNWIGMVRSVLGAVAYALLIVAVFIDRSGKNRVQRRDKDTVACDNDEPLARS
jgi:hypothetical protein